MTPTRSWWAAVAVALAVVLIAGGVYAATRSDGRAAPVGPPTPAIETPVPPTKSPTVRPPEPPRTTGPPTVGPTLPPPRDTGPPPPGTLPAVPVAGYQLTPQADRLRLHYYIGVPECYGVVDPRAGGVTAVETTDSVRVLLRRMPPRTDGSRACIDRALARSVTIALDAPLGSRAVIDASTCQRVPRRSLEPR